MRNFKNQNTNKKRALRNRIICIAMLLIILSNLCGCGSKETKCVEDYFVKYEGATTLVEICYGEPTLFGYKSVSGFIDDDVYEKCMNNEYDGNIKLYHPYTNGRSITIDSKTIATMDLHTYNSYYEDFPPRIYAD